MFGTSYIIYLGVNLRYSSVAPTKAWKTIAVKTQYMEMLYDDNAKYVLRHIS